MKLMGQMFIVLIFIMSIMFCLFSVVIYSEHINWKKCADDWKAVAEDAKAKAQQLETSKNAEIEQVYARASESESKFVQLREARDDFKGKFEKAEKEKADLTAQEAEGIESVRLSHATMASLRAEVEGLRTALRGAQEDWAKQYSELVAKTDEANNLKLQLATYQEVGNNLAKDYSDAIEVLKKHGLKPVPELYNGVPPKGIQGIVTEVRPGAVQISVGEDSGLVKGQKLDVIRNYEDRSSYIGKIEIIDTAPDSAAAKIMPEYRRGTVQRGDSVLFIDTTELSAK